MSSFFKYVIYCNISIIVFLYLSLYENIDTQIKSLIKRCMNPEFLLNSKIVCQDSYHLARLYNFSLFAPHACCPAYHSWSRLNYIV
jgi:hypothetical protein